MPILCRDLNLISYDQAHEWIKGLFDVHGQPVPIPKTKSTTPPFYAQPEGTYLLLKANEKDRRQSTYNLTRERWSAFVEFVENNPEINQGDLATNYRAYKCSDKTYWPAVKHISKAFINRHKKK